MTSTLWLADHPQQSKHHDGNANRPETGMQRKKLTHDDAFGNTLDAVRGAAQRGLEQVVGCKKQTTTTVKVTATTQKDQQESTPIEEMKIDHGHEPVFSNEANISTLSFILATPKRVIPRISLQTPKTCSNRKNPTQHKQNQEHANFHESEHIMGQGSAQKGNTTRTHPR